MCKYVYIIHTCVFKCIYIYMLVHMITIVYVYSAHKLSALLEACSK